MKQNLTITPERLSTLVELEQMVRKFYASTLTLSDYWRSAAIFQRNFPEQFENMFGGLEVFEAENHAHIIVFSPMFGGWDLPERDGEYYSLWRKHIYLAGLAAE
jgi:hypothetical protein